MTIGVIKDMAFQFYYPENLEALERSGAVLRTINALEEDRLPDVDLFLTAAGEEVLPAGTTAPAA